jgi:hypothetical protein
LPFSSLSKLYKYACSKNHFPQPKRHVLTFLHSILLCRAPYWGPLGMFFYRLHDVSWPCFTQKAFMGRP